MPDFQITQIIGNKVLLRYGALSFYVYIDIIDGKQIVSKPRSVYIDEIEFLGLVRLVKNKYNTHLESMKNNESKS